MSEMRFLPAMCVLSALALPLHAQNEPIDVLTHIPARAYEGQMVVRVRTTSQSQLDALLAIATDVWSERAGVGVLEVVINRADRARLSVMGVTSDVLIEDLQAHVDADWERIVAQTRTEAQQDDRSDRGAGVHDDSWFSNYRQLMGIESYIRNIESLRPDLACVSVIGRSWEGRDMLAITISAPDAPGNSRDDRPAVFIFSTVHAREWIAPMTTCYIASRLASDYGVDARVTAMLNAARVVIVPIGNPDGYLYSWTDRRLWRNTRRDNGDGTFGVNINRNWGYEWGNEGSSGDTSDTNYRGTEPFSEPETRALRDVALSLGDKLVAHIDYHSFSQLIMWPYAYAHDVVTPEPAATVFELLATEMANVIDATTGAFYNPIQAVDLYPAAGESPDWFFGELGKTSYTIELRPIQSDFSPPPNQILPCAQENYEAFKVLVEKTIEPVSIWGDLIDELVTGTPTPVAAIATSGLMLYDQAPTLHARIGETGPFTPIPMTPEGDTYAATLPPATCGSMVQYYYSVNNTSGRTVTHPRRGADAPAAAMVRELVTVVDERFETDTGWIVGAPGDTATEGIWTRMNPEGTDAQPDNDHSPDGALCWITDGRAGVDANDGDVDGGHTSLISPRLDATGAGADLDLTFWYWYSGSTPNPDPFLVSLSNDDGATWTNVDYIRGDNNQWTLARYPVRDYVEPTDQIRVRFQASDYFRDNTIEVAIDDLRFEFTGCPTHNPADLNGDGRLNFFDVSLFLTAFAQQDPVADFNNDGAWNFFDISDFLTAFSAGIP